MINDKISSEKIILAIVILVAVGLLVYFIMPKNYPNTVQLTLSPIITPIITSTPEPTLTPTLEPAIVPTPAPNMDINSWKTFRNEKFAYSVKYPVEWYFYADNSSDVFIQPDDIKNIPEDSAPGQHASALEINITSVKSGYDPIKAGGYDQIGTGISFTKESVTIGGVQGLKAISACDGVGCGNPEWFVIKDNYLYHFNSNLGHSEIFDKIISTFKFIEKDKVTGWNIYRNEEHGYNVSYPSSWFAYDSFYNREKHSENLDIQNFFRPEIGGTSGIGGIGCQLNVWVESDKYSSIQEWIGVWKNSIGLDLERVSAEEVKLGGIKGLTVTFFGTFEGSSKPEIVILNNGVIYVVKQSWQGVPQETCQPVFDKILTAFKFTK